jgi:chromosome segregation ATPase
MLQDLDQLAARIGQLVQRTRQLHAERDALRARLNKAEQESRSLLDRCKESDAQLHSMHERLQDHDSETLAKLVRAEESEAELRAELQRLSERQQAADAQVAAREGEWQARLSARDTDLQRLRVAAVAARERIDAVLARLPGAPAGEQQ